ncbi:MAG: hypothetical protein JWM11_6672 [Planctomycetaceae bacterium]|nr:hypothetical protein [Planctomycetaceae bacterium]
MRNEHLSKLSVLAIVIVCDAVGCGTSTTTIPLGTNLEQQTDRLEHHVSEHRPASFAVAVEQIQSRHNQIHNEIQTKTHPALDHQLSELQDILGWLPEIAGDSDLRQADWNLVKQHSQQLANLYQELHQKVANGIRPEQSSFDKMETLNEGLRKLVPASDRLH